jgi:hypothetical protein
MIQDIKTIPIPFNEISDIFLNIDKTYRLDLKNSKLKGESFVTYIANMKLKCEVINDSSLEKEEKFEVLKNFLTYAYFVDCSTFIDSLLLVFLRYRNIPFQSPNAWLTTEEIDEFISLNKELIDVAADFYDSLLLAIPSFNTKFKKEILEPSLDKGDIKLIEDPNLISINVISLLKVPNFLENFISGSDFASKELKYYKYQIEKFSYDKKNLFDILMDLKENSFILSLTNIFYSEEKEEEEILEKHMKVLGVI